MAMKVSNYLVSTPGIVKGQNITVSVHVENMTDSHWEDKGKKEIRREIRAKYRLLKENDPAAFRTLSTQGKDSYNPAELAKTVDMTPAGLVEQIRRRIGKGEISLEEALRLKAEFAAMIEESVPTMIPISQIPTDTEEDDDLDIEQEEPYSTPITTPLNSDTPEENSVLA